MHIFAQRPEEAQQTMAAKSTLRARGHLGPGAEWTSLHSQPTEGNQAGQELEETTEGDGNGKARGALGHDFSQIPVVSPHQAESIVASHSNPGSRSVATRHEYILSASIPRVGPASQCDSMGINERNPVMEFNERPTQTPIASSRKSTQEPREGETVYFTELPAIEIPAQSDAIASTLTYVPNINPILPPAVLTKFGDTTTRVEVKRSSGDSVNGKFEVKLVIDLVIDWWAAGGNKKNIGSDTDPNITQANYPVVVADLTPSPTAVHRPGVDLFKNQPPRSQYWAKDLTIKHDRFHVDENVKFGQEGADLAKNWMDRQTAKDLNEVGVLVGRASGIVANKILAAMAPPAVEQRAYDFGAADYTARVRAIKTRGDARGYVPKPPAPAPQPPAAPPAPAPKVPTVPREPKGDEPPAK